MALLPTFDVNATVQARIMAAFSDAVDETTGEPVTPAVGYKQWLKRNLINFVVESERESEASDKRTEIESGMT